jgi:hypothetical protein
MSYQLNKTDGTILTDLIDGQIDTTTTNLTLVGRNYSGYGEYFNENFIKLLENFSNTAAPSNPLTGQTWWDTNDQRLKVYDGEQWKASGGPFVQSTRPQMVAGDLWIDSLNNQVYAFDGFDLILVGPEYTQTQGVSGFKVDSILDQQSRSRTVVYQYVGGEITAVISNLEFTPVYSQRVLGLVTDDNPDGIIYKGINVIDSTNFKFYGTSSAANALVTEAGIVRTADSFLPSTSNGLTTGTLTISNSGGLTIGVSQNTVQKIVGPRFYIENQITDEDIHLRVKSSLYGSITVDAIKVDASTGRVGIFNVGRPPEYTLDVEGDLRVTGNLLVEGETTSIDVATLRVEDKNIEIAKTSDGDTLTGADADNAGLILDTSDSGSKTWTWINAENAWTSNVNVDISDDTKTYQIGGEDKLTDTSLTNITDITHVVRISSRLEYLDIDDININGATITNAPTSLSALTFTSSTGVVVNAGGTVTLDNQIITGVAKTDAITGDPTDAASKAYVDEQTSLAPLVFSLDVTGLGSGSTLQDNIAEIIESMYPASVQNNGKEAKIHTTSYAGATVGGINVTVTQAPDYSGVLTKSDIPVDANGTLNASVIQDIVASNTASGSVVLTPVRTLMTYESNGTNWVYQNTTTPYSF